MQNATLTFLLSDIEHSTRRWDLHDAAMGPALKRHDELLRAAIGSQGGRWVKHTGDGGLAAFPGAIAAVSAAVDAQRAITSTDWSSVGGLRARMAIHTGDATERDGDYFGPTLNRASRLLDAAHGGQVLISLATEELVRDRLPDEIRLRDLGTHALADLSRPERVFQLDAAGLPSAFPPLRTTGQCRVVLPTFRTSFVGREEDLTALAVALDEHRLVTLTGVGGSGKTRLAVEFARAVQDRFPDGVFFVDLAAITDDELVPRQTARAVGVVSGAIVGGSSEPIREQVLRTVADRRMLIVLDNCEHLLDACAEHVEDLLAASASLQVVATSREALALDGEQSWPVTSLPLPTTDADEAASVRLLLDRVLELRPDYEVDNEDRTHLAQICRRLDGLPLALELAAARLAHLSPADVASRLDDRFRLLTGGRRRTERQQTLRATIDWSYDLLDERERSVLRRFSVFAGSAPLEAVEAVTMAGLEDEFAVDVLGRLASRSLVVTDTESAGTRFRLLETIRAYSEEKLVAAGEAAEARSDHRDWYLNWLESLPWDLRMVSPVVMGHIQREYDDIRLALEWSESEGRAEIVARFVSALAGFGALNGYVDELDRWRVVALDAPLSPADAAGLDLAVSMLDLWRFDGDVAIFDEVRKVALQAHRVLPTGDPRRALARLNLAASYSPYPDEWQAMEQAAAEAGELADAAGAPWVRIAATGLQAKARLYGRDPERAAQLVYAAMELPAWSPEHDGHNVRHDLAVALHLIGEQDEALDYAVAVASDGAVAWRHVGLLDTAMITAAKGRPDTARGHVARALADLQTMRWQHPLALTDCTVVLGAIATFEARWEAASRLLAVSRGSTSHPTLFAVWVHYRDLVRAALPRELRRRCISEGRALDTMEAIEQELARR